jgi:hypothetical protein
MVTIFSPATHRLVTASKTFWEMAAALRYLVRVSGLFRVWSDKRSSQHTRSRPICVCGCAECLDIPQIAGSKHPTTIRILGGALLPISSVSFLSAMFAVGWKESMKGGRLREQREGWRVCLWIVLFCGLNQSAVLVWQLVCGLCPLSLRLLRWPESTSDFPFLACGTCWRRKQLPSILLPRDYRWVRRRIISSATTSDKLVKRVIRYYDIFASSPTQLLTSLRTEYFNCSALSTSYPRNSL